MLAAIGHTLVMSFAIRRSPQMCAPKSSSQYAIKNMQPIPDRSPSVSAEGWRCCAWS